MPSATRGAGVVGTGPCLGGTGFPSGPSTSVHCPVAGSNCTSFVSPGLPVGISFMSGGLLAVGCPVGGFSTRVWTTPI